MESQKKHEPRKEPQTSEELTDSTLGHVAGGMRPRRDGTSDGKCWNCGSTGVCDCGEIER